jgi:polyferredoxin
MAKRGGKKYLKVQKEVDSFLYDRDRKELESFIDEKDKKEPNKNVKQKKQKTTKKFSKQDIVFLFIYAILLFLFILITYLLKPYSIADFITNIVRLRYSFWIVLYALLIPILFFIIRWANKRKK